MSVGIHIKKDEDKNNRKKKHKINKLYLCSVGNFHLVLQCDTVLFQFPWNNALVMAKIKQLLL